MSFIVLFILFAGRDGSAVSHTEESYDSNTLFSSKIGDEIFLKPNRPALVVSSTSW